MKIDGLISKIASEWFIASLKATPEGLTTNELSLCFSICGEALSDRQTSKILKSMPEVRKVGTFWILA